MSAIGTKRKLNGYMEANEARPFPAESEAVAGYGYLERSAVLHVWATYRPDPGSSIPGRWPKSAAEGLYVEHTP